jgi:hypothetical protein
VSYTFSGEDISVVSSTLGSDATVQQESWSFRISGESTKQSLVCTLQNNVRLDEEHAGSLVTVQTQHGYFELHDCSGYVKVEPDEIIFVAVSGEFMSCIVIGRGATCSQFSNIRRSIISADFANLDAAVLMAAMQLSLTEEIVV